MCFLNVQLFLIKIIMVCYKCKTLSACVFIGTCATLEKEYSSHVVPSVCFIHVTPGSTHFFNTSLSSFSYRAVDYKVSPKEATAPGFRSFSVSSATSACRLK